MKKVGIISIYDENNYGNRLQNYAVQEIIKKMGFEVETIKNTNICNGENYLDRVLTVDKRRREKFLEFNEKYMNNSDEVVFHHKIDDNFHNNYDYFIIGSDQIWNYNFEDRFSDIVFAPFAPFEKRISFSASFGINQVPKEDYIHYKELAGMKAISVREEAGAKIVKDITGREDAVVLLDPTMTIAREEWKKIAKEPENLTSKKYILEYFLGKVSPERREVINKFAKENGCEIIDILELESFGATGPSEFIYLIENAYLVLTDSFHSSVFSILFETPFLVFDRIEAKMENMGSRLDTLLNKFNLHNRKYNGYIDKSHIDNDYRQVNKILDIERQKTLKFLKDALEVTV